MDVDAEIVKYYSLSLSSYYYSQTLDVEITIVVDANPKLIPKKKKRT